MTKCCDDNDHWQSDMFRSMNTEISVILSADYDENSAQLIDDMFAFIHNWFCSTERRFSRFKFESELSQINRSNGNPIVVSAAMIEVLELVEGYRVKTNGLFSPFILRALEDAGYDKSFEQLSNPLNHSNPLKQNATKDQPLPPIQDAKMFEFNKGIRSVKLIMPHSIDLGGIVKGWAVGKLTLWLKNHWGIRRGLINAGGDLSVWGGSSFTKPWIVAISSPGDNHVTSVRIKLREGSVATSSVLGRNWKTIKGDAHHLIDPRTMLPSKSDVIQCTVIGTTTADCEIAAKVVCILGHEEGKHWLTCAFPQYNAVLILNDGSLVMIGNDMEEMLL